MKCKASPGPASRLAHDEGGGPLAEFALVLPLLLVIVFGTMEFANVLYQQHIITKGAQEAARFAARSPALVTSTSCSPTGSDWTAATTAAANIAATGRTSGGTQIMPNLSAADVTITVECPASSGLISSNPDSGAIPVVLATVSIDYRSLGFLTLLNLSDFSLSAQHREMGVGL